MNRWNLAAIALVTVVGCHKSSQDTQVTDDTRGATPVDQATITGATVEAPLMTPPPAIDNAAPLSETPSADPGTTTEDQELDKALQVSASGAGSSAMQGALPAPRTHRPSATDDGEYPSRRDFPETSFGSPNTESASGSSFPESSFGDQNTPAAARDAGTMYEF